MNKKKNLIKWAVYLLIIIVIPFLIVKVSRTEQEIYQFLSFHIVFIIPISVIGLKWYEKRTMGLTNKEILKTLTPLYWITSKIIGLFNKKEQ